MAPALFLFFFAPVSAEYLIGYDDTVGNPAVLTFGLLIFGPLYGAPALLIRAKYATNTVLLAIVLLLVGLAARAQRRYQAAELAAAEGQRRQVLRIKDCVSSSFSKYLPHDRQSFHPAGRRGRGIRPPRPQGRPHPGDR